MATGTDAELLGKTQRKRTKTNGRPRVNRELGYQLVKAGYSTRYIRRVLKCSARTIRLMKQELKERGDIKETEKTEELDKVALDFDEECERAVGISFLDWLKGSLKYHKSIFNFNKKIWEKVWGKPSLILTRDRGNQLGDQLCMKFLKVFGEDKKRIRSRKKRIRYIFRFLGRRDLCDRYLRMPVSSNPEPVREIPEITLQAFPEKLDTAIEAVRQLHGEEMATALRFKVCTMMRTGKRSDERELMGITVGKANGGSWLIMAGPDEFRGEVKAKRNERWLLQWIPPEVRQELYQVYDARERGQKLFQFNIDDLRDAFKEACEDTGLPPLHLHDLRKVAITWLWVMGVPLELATELNVGWKDLNTAKKFYLRMRGLLKKRDRIAYRENIPGWFKQGLEEYTD